MARLVVALLAASKTSSVFGMGQFSVTRECKTREPILLSDVQPSDVDGVYGLRIPDNTYVEVDKDYPSYWIIIPEDTSCVIVNVGNHKVGRIYARSCVPVRPPQRS